MGLFERVAGCQVDMESVDTERTDSGGGTSFDRSTTIVSVHGGGETGRGVQ